MGPRRSRTAPLTKGKNPRPSYPGGGGAPIRTTPEQVAGARRVIAAHATDAEDEKKLLAMVFGGAA